MQKELNHLKVQMQQLADAAGVTLQPQASSDDDADDDVGDPATTSAASVSPDGSLPERRTRQRTSWSISPTWTWSSSPLDFSCDQRVAAFEWWTPNSPRCKKTKCVCGLLCTNMSYDIWTWLFVQLAWNKLEQGMMVQIPFQSVFHIDIASGLRFGLSLHSGKLQKQDPQQISTYLNSCSHMQSWPSFDFHGLQVTVFNELLILVILIHTYYIFILVQTWKPRGSKRAFIIFHMTSAQTYDSRWLTSVRKQSCTMLHIVAYCCTSSKQTMRFARLKPARSIHPFMSQLKRWGCICASSIIMYHQLEYIWINNARNNEWSWGGAVTDCDILWQSFNCRVIYKVIFHDLPGPTDLARTQIWSTSWRGLFLLKMRYNQNHLMSVLPARRLDRISWKSSGSTSFRCLNPRLDVTFNNF